MEKILIAEDDPDARFVLETCLTEAGYQVLSASDGRVALELLRAHRPRVALLDLMMPRTHGFSVLQQMREDPELQGTYVIVLSAKAYPVDIRTAKELGASDYLVKPYNPSELLGKIRNALEAIHSRLWVKFWGTRSLIPTSGPATRRYGGNTSCVEVRCGDYVLMLDCGSGAREMGLALNREFAGRPLEVHIFVSHTRWDHLLGFPFLTPAYLPGANLTVYKPRRLRESLEKLFTGQVDASYFPESLAKMQTGVRFVELGATIQIGETKVSHAWNDSGQTVCFRIDFRGNSVVYITERAPHRGLSGESEQGQDRDRALAAFAKDADLYIREAQYPEEEYAAHRGPEHSPPAGAVLSAHEANVKRLVLFHHDPMHDDEFLDRMVADCRAYMQQCGMTFECLAASDGLHVSL